MHELPFQSLSAGLSNLASFAFIPLMVMAFVVGAITVVRGSESPARLAPILVAMGVLAASRSLLQVAGEKVAGEGIEDTGPGMLAAAAGWLSEHGWALLIGLGVVVASGMTAHRAMAYRYRQATCARHLRELLDAIDRAETGAEFWAAAHDEGQLYARDRADTLYRVRHDLLDLLAVVHAGQPLDATQYAKLGNLVSDISRCEKRDQDDRAPTPAPQRGIRSPRVRTRGSAESVAATSSEAPLDSLGGTLYTATLVTAVSDSFAEPDNCRVCDLPSDCGEANGSGSPSEVYDSGTGCDAGGGSADP